MAQTALNEYIMTIEYFLSDYYCLNLKLFRLFLSQ